MKECLMSRAGDAELLGESDFNEIYIGVARTRGLGFWMEILDLSS